MLKEAVLSQLRRGLDSHESDEPYALDYLQRLNLAGYDVKGQVSSALGQAGLGVGLSAGVDFGAVLIPFVHLELGANVASEGTADGLLVLHRLSHRLWKDDIVQPQQTHRDHRDAPLPPPFLPPFWSSRTPLALAFLRGKSFRLNAGVYARAWAGAGTFDDIDETGLTVGVALAADGGGTITRLIDESVRHYPASSNGSALREDVDALFDANLKNKVAAWLIGTGGGVKELVELGAPRRSLADQAADGEVQLDKPLLQLAAAFDELTIPDVDAISATGVGVSVLKGLRAVGRKVRDAVKGDKLTTQALQSQLASVKEELEGWQRALAEPNAEKIFGKNTCINLSALAARRLAQVKRFQEALDSRKTAKAAKPPAPQASLLPFKLDISCFEGSASATASAKLVLPRDKVKLQIEAGAKVRARRNVFRYQAFVPSYVPALRLRWTQDTVVTYVSRRLSVDGAAQSRSFSKDRSNLVTMSYRSAQAQWFDSRGAPDQGMARPNGSGVSFGMSVLARSFAAYARFCKFVKDDPKNPEATLDDGLKALEKALKQQLRVGEDELRKFMRNAPSSMGRVKTSLDEEDVVGSYLVESAFAFTKPVALKLDTPKTGPQTSGDLFELAPAANLIKSGTPGPELRLQAIRLRYRIQTGDEREDTMIELGWNPEPWGEDAPDAAADAPKSLLERVTGFDPTLPNWLKMSALAIEVGIELKWIRRVGCEGLIDIHTQLYPDPYNHEKPPEGYGRDLAKRHEERNWRDLSDILVPPVTLFRQ
ncbi:MAG: hypothetical protein ACKVP5_07780 [Aestuariivirga sp.]